MYKDYNMFKRPFKYRPVRLLGLKSGGLTVPQATRRTAKSAARRVLCQCIPSVQSPLQNGHYLQL